MQIETHFTKDKKVKKIILNHLNNTQNHVCVAVAWFTDTVLFSKLIELIDRGIQVEVIITNHEFNTKSNNNYNLIEEKGGFFAQIGNDDKLMHMKFCVIDCITVISGSANWSNKAFTSNNEEVTIVEGHQQRANDFINEFERLKLLSGKIKSLEKELNLSKAFKIFDLIKAFINIGETTNVHPYIHQLKNIEGLENIVNELLDSNFENAIKLMDVFKKSNSQILDITTIEKEKIIAQINLISIQIETLSIEKAETESLIEQFNHRYILELNPLIGKILKLKRKIYEKLKKHGIIDDTFEKAEEEFRKNNEEYLEELKIEIPILSEDENLTLKEMYREAVKYCHPDSPKCIYEDKQKAAEIFTELTNAYKLKDVKKVKHLLTELKLGNPIDNLNQKDELDNLRAKLSTLQSKYSILLFNLKELKLSEKYQQIISIKDWDIYFKSQKELLDEQFNKLNNEFVKNE
jgi:hypothetical protein